VPFCPLGDLAAGDANFDRFGDFVPWSFQTDCDADEAATRGRPALEIGPQQQAPVDLHLSHSLSLDWTAATKRPRRKRWL